MLFRLVNPFQIARATVASNLAARFSGADRC